MSEPPLLPISDATLDELRQLLGDRLSTDLAETEAVSTDCWSLSLLRKRSGDLRDRAQAVAWPETTAEVQAILRLAQRERFAVTPYGGGSGVSGGVVPTHGGLTIDLKRMRRLVAIREVAGLCEVEAGMLGQPLEDALNARGFTLGHFPSSIYSSTVGGWLAARSSGQASTRYGSIEHLTAGLEAVLPDGQVAVLSPQPRTAAGPDWRHVLIGSEGTLGVITRAWLRITRLPAARRFLTFRFPSLPSGLAAIREVLQRGYRPAVVRLYDPLDTLVGVSGGGGVSGFTKTVTDAVFDKAKKLLLAHPTWAQVAERFAGGCHAVFVTEGDPPLADLEASVIAACCAATGAEDRGPDGARHWHEHRYHVSYKGSPIFGAGGFVDTMEVAAPWDRLDALYREVRSAIAPHAVTLAHVSHAYVDGASIYFSFAASYPTLAASEAAYARIWKDGLEASLAAGGTSTHHHGVGLLKVDALRQELGPLHDALRGLKRALDPAGVLNPGKLGLTG